jgi:hypothetical protein
MCQKSQSTDVSTTKNTNQLLSREEKKTKKKNYPEKGVVNFEMMMERGDPKMVFR